MTLAQHFEEAIPYAYIESKPFLQHSVHLFSRPGTAPLKSLEELKGKTVAVPPSSNILKNIEGLEVETLASQTEPQRVEALMNRRVDYLLSSSSHVQLVAHRLGIEMPAFDPEISFADLTLHVSCHNTPEARKAIEIINKHIDASFKDGSLKAIFENYGLDTNVYFPE